MNILWLPIVVLLGALAAPSFAVAQGKVARIGWLSAGTAEIDADLMEGLRRGLKELRHVEGKGYRIESHFTAGRPERLPEAAAALAASKVDVIVASGDQAALAAKRATGTIPVVVQVADAIGIGLVTSLAHPGGNVTGASDLHADLVPKRLEILKELVPNLSRAAFLSNPRNPTCVRQASEIRAAAPSFGLALHPVEVAGAEDMERAFGAIAKEKVGGLIVCGDRMLATHRSRIYELATKQRLPTMYANRRFVHAGGLISYGTNLADLYQRLAVQVDRILKGAKPGDLPLEQPTKFEVVINLRAAKAIGLTVPRPLLLRADHIVE
ncbi:MAG TPA: ABC transporter substrate-binding protein [Burkholderiales bacterium]|nr:ABC transporter substrate-binding protein [Burkholderiales bacterium]